MRLRARLESHFLIVGFTRVHTFVTWDSHELTHNLTGSHAQTAIPTKVDLNSTVITCVHTCRLWDSHVFTLFVCGMQRIHKHKKVGCALTESLLPAHCPIHPRGRGPTARPHCLLDDCHCVHWLLHKATCAKGPLDPPQPCSPHLVCSPINLHTHMRWPGSVVCSLGYAWQMAL